MEVASTIVLCIILNSALGDSYNYTPSNPDIYQNTSSKNLKNRLRQEKLQKVTQIINCLLMDTIEKDFNVMLEDLKQTKDFSKPDCNEETLAPVNDIIDGNIYLPENAEYNEEISKNSTIDFDKIIAKIKAALENAKDYNENTNPEEQSSTFELTPIFRLNKNEYKRKLNQNSFENPGKAVKKIKQAQVNSLTTNTNFHIPCHRAADIFKETSTFVIPKCAYCDDINHDSKHEYSKLISGNRITQITNSENYIAADTSVAVLYTPKTVSIMQVFRNLLKKITTTILVPFHVITFFEN